jgi:hypothetical protein
MSAPINRKISGGVKRNFGGVEHFIRGVIKRF